MNGRATRGNGAADTGAGADGGKNRRGDGQPQVRGRVVPLSRWTDGALVMVVEIVRAKRGKGRVGPDQELVEIEVVYRREQAKGEQG